MRKLLLLILSFAMVHIMLAQERTISGIVTSSEDGETLPGVAVVVKGTTTGTITDIDGAYILLAPDGADVIVFQYIGMKSYELSLGSGNNYNIVLEPDFIQLEKVVVTAIGIERESRELGYAVQGVEGEEIAKSREANVVSALSGKVAGVQITKSSGAPGGSASIKIRGNGSITQDSDPLFVIDGIPIDNSQYYSGNPDDGNNNLLSSVGFSNRAIDINPSDIESINVLKGPAATALYGLRAANGAVIITTKRGGRQDGRKMSVNFSSSVTFEEVNALPPLQSTFAQGITGEYLPPETGWLASWGPEIADLVFDSETAGTYGYDRNGTLIPRDSCSSCPSANNYDNLGTFFETGVTFDNHLSLSGGGDFADYYLSVGNTRIKGIVPNSDFTRTSLKLTGSADLTEKFKTTTSLTYTNSGGKRVQQGSNTSGLMLGLLRTPPSFDNSNGLDDPTNGVIGPDADGDPQLYGINAYEFADGSQRNFRGGGGYDNPYWTVNNSPFQDDVNRVLGYTQFDYKPLNWLSFLYRVGADVYSDRRTQFFEIGSRTLPAGQVFNDEHFNLDLNQDIMATASYDFTDDFYGRLTVGHNMFRTFHRQIYVQGDGLNIPGFEDISNASTILTKDITTEKRTAAVYFDANLAYRNFLYLNITGRNEWSSSLPEENNSFFYPALSLGFDFTEAFGISENDILPYGKIRASWAQVGNDAPVYGTASYYTAANWADGWTNGIFYPIDGVNSFSNDDVLGNNQIEPEKTTSWEIGADLRFFRNRLGLDITYYQSKGEDLIIQVPVSTASGYIEALLNAGEIENKGLELVVSANVVKVSDFRWDILLNWSKNKNEVTALAEGVETIFLNGFTGTSSRAVAGQPYGVLFGGQWLRDEDGNRIIDDEGFPIVDPEEGILGDPNPDWLMGITNTFSWKGLSLSALLDIRQGGDVWNGTKGALTFFGMSELTETRGETIVFDGVKESDGSPNDVEVVLDEDWYLGNGGGFGDQAEDFIEDGGWVRLREVTLSYDLPSSVFKNSLVNGLGLYFTVVNAFVITDYDGIDPETNLTGASNGFGLEYFNMPNTRSYTFGLRLGL